jgi:dihydrofolate reductase
MRRLILQMQVSVDGYVAAVQPGLHWQIWNWGDHWPWDDALKRDFNTIFDSIDGILLSRKMVEEGYLEHWARVASRFPSDPNYAFAKKITDVSKVVVSSQLKASRWARTEVIKGGLIDEVNALKRRPGGPLITFGGVGFASSLVAADLVDEFQFFVNPTAVSEGYSIFHQPREGLRFELIRSDSYGCGMVVNRYRPTAAPAAD